jgi:hypothetical protein
LPPHAHKIQHHAGHAHDYNHTLSLLRTTADLLRRPSMMAEITRVPSASGLYKAGIAALPHIVVAASAWSFAGAGEDSPTRQ